MGPEFSSACHKVLRSAADVEDTFQATFLVLLREGSRIRRRQSLGAWLYGVAHRLALQARSAAIRRSRHEARKVAAHFVEPADLSWTEACAILHEELDRLPEIYRMPLLLRYLEGKSRDEAANLLGCTWNVLHGRLERGRDRLRARLTKRGVTLAAGLLAAVNSSAPAAGPSDAMIEALLTAATTGSCSSTVAVLVHGGTISMIYGKLKTLLVTVLVIGLIAGGISMRMSAATPTPAAPMDEKAAAVIEDKKPTKERELEEIEVSGRVVDPDGKPVDGAAILLPYRDAASNLVPTELGKTDAEGKFQVKVKFKLKLINDRRCLVARAEGFAPDWIPLNEINNKPVTLRLVPDDVTVRGRVIDLQGKPVTNTIVHIERIQTTATGSLDAVFKDWRKDPQTALSLATKRLDTLACLGLPSNIEFQDGGNDAQIKVDKEGRFEIKGLGRDRIISLAFDAPGIANTHVRVVTQPKFDPKAVVAPDAERSIPFLHRPGPDLYGPEFIHIAQPEAIIAGRVTDIKTGKPIAGMLLIGHGPWDWIENQARTTTDAEGRYRIRGLANLKNRSVGAWQSPNSAYLETMKSVRDADGLTETILNIELVRGVFVNGRITEKTTGEPIQGAFLTYDPLRENKEYQKFAGTGIFTVVGFGSCTNANGEFRLLTLPGPGLITAQADTLNNAKHLRYTNVRVDPADEFRTFKQNGLPAFPTVIRQGNTLNGQSAYKLIDPPEDAETYKADMHFKVGESLSGTVIDPDGKPVEGAAAYGLTAVGYAAEKLKTNTFTVIGIDPKETRTIVFLSPERKLAGALELKGTEKTPPVVKLRPWAAATGRVVDRGGEPIAGVEVSFQLRTNYRFQTYELALSDTKAVTDAEGKFRIDMPFGDVEFHLQLMHKGQYQNERAKSKVASGKIIDVGTIELQPAR